MDGTTHPCIGPHHRPEWRDNSSHLPHQPQQCESRGIPDFISESLYTTNDKGTLDCTPHVLRVLDFLEVEAIIPIGVMIP